MKHRSSLLINSILLMGAISLTGCGGGSGGSSSSQIQASDDVSTYGYQWEDTSKPLIRTKGEVSFNIISSKNSLALDYNDMKVFQDLYDSTYVDAKFNNLSESAYSTQKTLILANESRWPDAIYHAGFTNKELIQYGSSRGVLTPIDEYLDYMPNFKAILASRPDIKRMLECPDGHIYSLPRVEEMGLKPFPNLLFINKKWLGQLIDSSKLSFSLSKDALVDGLKLKRSEYKEVLKLFHDNDMNGNGKTTDEIPCSFVHGNWQGNESDLIASFGLPENKDHKCIVNGNVTFTCQDKTWWNACKEINSWVKDGLIETAAFEDSQDSFLAKGKVDSNGYERLGSFYWWEMETVISASEQSNYIVMQPLVDDVTGKQYVGRSNEQEIDKAECVVFNKCAHKAILLSYLDRFYDPYVSAQLNYGPRGVCFEENLDASGMLVPKDPPEGMTTDELRLKNAPMGIIFLTEPEWKNKVHMESRAVLRLDRLEKYEKPYAYEGAEGFPNLTYSLAQVNTLAKYETSLGDVINSTFVKCLTDSSYSFADDSWTAFQNKLTKAGIEEVKKVNQDGYDAYVKTE